MGIEKDSTRLTAVAISCSKRSGPSQRTNGRAAKGVRPAGKQLRGATTTHPSSVDAASPLLAAPVAAGASGDRSSLDLLNEGEAWCVPAQFPQTVAALELLRTKIMQHGISGISELHAAHGIRCDEQEKAMAVSGRPTPWGQMAQHWTLKQGARCRRRAERPSQQQVHSVAGQLMAVNAQLMPIHRRRCRQLEGCNDSIGAVGVIQRLCFAGAERLAWVQVQLRSPLNPANDLGREEIPNGLNRFHRIHQRQTHRSTHSARCSGASAADGHDVAVPHQGPASGNRAPPSPHR